MIPAILSKHLFPTRFPLACVISLSFSFLSLVLAEAEEKSASELSQLKGKEFFAALSSYSSPFTEKDRQIPPPERKRLLEHFVNEVNRVGFTNSARWAFEQLLSTLSKQGDRDDFQATLKVWEKSNANGFDRSTGLLLDFAIRLEVDSIVTNKTPIRISIPPFLGKVPPLLSKAAPELLEAWKKFQSIEAFQGRNVADTNRPWISFQGNSSNFFKAVGDLLHQNGTNGFETISLYEWGFWCGTGSERLYTPKHQALFLAALRARKWDSALGLAFHVTKDQQSPFGNESSDDQWRRDFLTACGLDWEELYAGATISGDDWQRRPAETARVLAQYGSERGAHLLLDMENVFPIREKDDYLRAISVLIQPAKHKKSDDSFSSADYERVAQTKISESLQLRLLDVLCRSLSSKTGADNAAMASDRLAFLARVESKEALQTALKSPYNEVRENAAKGLRAMGENVPPPAVLPPVKFLLRTNGVPLRRQGIEYALERSDQSSLMTSGDTDSSGVLAVSSDPWVDPKVKVKKIVFESSGNYSENPDPNQCWFSFACARPAHLEATTDVNIPISSLTLNLKHPRSVKPPRGKTMEIHFKPVDDEVRLSTLERSFHIPFTNRVCFPALQAKRRYDLELYAPGAAKWTSQVLLNAHAEAINVVLQPGFDVICTVFPPGAKDPEPFIACELLRDDSKESLHQNMHFLSIPSPIIGDDGSIVSTPSANDPEQTNVLEWNNVPSGKYHLHVFSSEELRAQRPKNEIVKEKLAYLGTNILITIDKDSPPTIDLGAIHLRAGH